MTNGNEHWVFWRAVYEREVERERRESLGEKYVFPYEKSVSCAKMEGKTEPVGVGTPRGS
jgi:hypothetical protein